MKNCPNYDFKIGYCDKCKNTNMFEAMNVSSYDPKGCSYFKNSLEFKNGDKLSYTGRTFLYVDKHPKLKNLSCIYRQETGVISVNTEDLKNI